MKLKTRVTSLDDVPEQYRERYMPAEDGKSFSLDEIELEDTSGLKANHDRLLKQLKASQEEQKKLKETYGDIDPVKAREAQTKLEELENKSLMDEGKFEELFMKRTEAMKRDHENQLNAMVKKHDAEAKRAAELETALKRTVIEKDLSTEAARLNVQPEFIPFLQLAAKEAWTLDEEGKAVWKQDGQIKFGKDPSKPATMADYLTDQIAAAPSLVKGSTGTGANGNAQHGNGQLSISRGDLRDVRKYEAVRKQADAMKIPLESIQITD